MHSDERDNCQPKPRQEWAMAVNTTLCVPDKAVLSIFKVGDIINADNASNPKPSPRGTAPNRTTSLSLNSLKGSTTSSSFDRLR